MINIRKRVLQYIMYRVSRMIGPTEKYRQYMAKMILKLYNYGVINPAFI